MNYRKPLLPCGLKSLNCGCWAIILQPGIGKLLGSRWQETLNRKFQGKIGHPKAGEEILVKEKVDKRRIFCNGKVG